MIYNIENSTGLAYQPWQVVPASSKQANSLRIFCDSFYLATVGNSDFEFEKNLAVAKLMAAAPDLYRALDNLLSLVTPIDERMPLSWRACLSEAKEALDKANE